MSRRYKILDFYCHQGNQAEFMKADHDFWLVGPSGSIPNWNKDHRPLPSNVTLISELEAQKLVFDIVIIRTPISITRYKPFIDKGAVPIATIQTTTPIALPPMVKHIVWNSRDAMRRYIGFYRNRIQHHIVHGYDPEQFTMLNLEKNGRTLTVANHFKKRSEIMGFDIWRYVKSHHPECDVIGSKNEDIPGAIDHLNSLNELIYAYNSYSIYFNPTRSSAMPRSRAEAAMCGMPIVSTLYYDVSNYFKPNRDALLSNNPAHLLKYIKDLSTSEQMRIDYGHRAREVAIKYFHLDDYLKKWNQVFDDAIKS